MVGKYFRLSSRNRNERNWKEVEGVQTTSLPLNLQWTTSQSKGFQLIPQHTDDALTGISHLIRGRKFRCFSVVSYGSWVPVKFSSASEVHFQ